MRNEMQPIRGATAVLMVAGLLAGACFTGLAAAKEKKKVALPDFVLWARSVAVVIDPDAGTPVNDPGGNLTAQDDVEKALMNWGRLRLTMDVAHADLVIVLRRGTGQGSKPTGGSEPNDRPVIIQQTDSAIRIGTQQGHPVDVTQPGRPAGPGMGGEVGPSDDAFSVYRGQLDAPLENAPVWRYLAKNALHSPEVPAVGEFIKAVDEAVKQQQQKQHQQPQQPQKP